MEQMREYPSEFAKPLLLCFDLLLNRCNIGFFDENVPFAVKYWRFGYMIPLVVIHYLSATAYIFKVSTGPVKTSELAYMIPVYLILIQSLVKALIIIPKRRDIAQLVTRLGYTWRLQNLTENQIAKKSKLLKKLNLNHVVFYWGSIIATYQHLITPLVLTLYRTFVLNQQSALQLPFASVYPFDPVQNWFIYLITYAIQSYPMLIIAYFYTGTESLMITLSAYVTTEFTLLREDLLEVIAVGDEVNSTRGLEQTGPIPIQEFIRRHQKLIQLTKQLDNIYNRMIFVNLLFATVINCFFAFGATVAQGLLDKVNNYAAVFVLMFPIHVFCSYGDLLKEESAGIAASAYENLWYRGNTRYQKIISFIIMRSQRACCLTSMEYTPITLKTFTKVVSTTWSYFSLAMSLYAKGNRN